MGFRQQNRAPRLLDPRPRRTLKARLPECRAFIPRVPGEEAQEVASAVIEAVDHRFSRLSVHDPSFDTSSAIDALSSSEKAFVTISGRIPFTFIVSGLTPDIWATINIRLYGEEAPSAARFVVIYLNNRTCYPLDLREFGPTAVAVVGNHKDLFNTAAKVQVLLLDPLDFLHDLQDTATAIGAVYKLDGDEPLGYDAMEIKDADGTCRLWRTFATIGGRCCLYPLAWLLILGVFPMHLKWSQRFTGHNITVTYGGVLRAPSRALADGSPVVSWAGRPLVGAPRSDLQLVREAALRIMVLDNVQHVWEAVAVLQAVSEMMRAGGNGSSNNSPPPQQQQQQQQQEGAPVAAAAAAAQPPQQPAGMDSDSIVAHAELLLRWVQADRQGQHRLSGLTPYLLQTPTTRAMTSAAEYNRRPGRRAAAKGRRGRRAAAGDDDDDDDDDSCSGDDIEQQQQQQQQQPEGRQPQSSQAMSGGAVGVKLRRSTRVRTAKKRY